MGVFLNGEDHWNKIKCPYCFQEFAHDRVHFRIADEACMEAQRKIQRTEGAEEVKHLSLFLKKKDIDEKYERIWGDSRGGVPSSDVRDRFYIPWIDETNKKDMIIGGYIKDNEGFVQKIEDSCGHYESKVRICPHCHNELPLHYGKNPQVFISILGVSNSGKTVFIKQLLSKVQSALGGGILNHVNGSFVKITLPKDDETYLELDKPLPDATKTLNFKIPYFVTMTFKNGNELETYDFVIYDVAGEVLSDYIIEKPEKFRFFAGYIEHSDAVIMIIDPKQLMDGHAPDNPATRMISTLFDVFGKQVTIPTAVTISKSDLLRTSPTIMHSLNPGGRFFGPDSNITNNIVWDVNKKYFYKDEHSRLLAELRNFYSHVAAPFLASANHNIKTPSYFAISSLYDGVDQILTFELRTINTWRSKDIDGYVSKFKILGKKLQDMGEILTKQEAEPEENYIDIHSATASRSFVFEQSDPMAMQLDNILSKVTTLNSYIDIQNAVYNEFVPESVISLSAADRLGDENLPVEDLIEYLWCMRKDMPECVLDITLQGYPRKGGTLQSLRIEEPFFWLLSQLGIIGYGNKYDMDIRQPKFKIDWSLLWPFGGKRK